MATAQSVFMDEGGLVVVEFESSLEPGAWNESVSTPGWVGDGYIRWDGPDLFNSPGAQGIFGFDFEVETGGTWILNIRNRHEDADPTEENDVWVRMDGGPWVKTFSNMAGSVGAWTWETRFDFAHNNQPEASYSLNTGQHRIEFSGRSFGFKMDRFHLFKAGTAGSNDPSRPESPRRVGSSYCTANSNSTGQIAEIAGVGSSFVSDNDLTLTCEGLPQNVFGIFVVSDTDGFTSNLAGTAGNLCLGGGLGRYKDDILNSGAAGVVELPINLTAIPRPSTFAAASAGQTWRFQFWHRDAPASGDANLSRGYRVTFQ